MVRLKLGDKAKELFEKLLFQSHNGSIKTNSVKYFPTDGTKFQSHNGSIKTDSLFLFIKVPEKISIPQWFD